MLKALFKKQLMEINTWLLQDKKKGKRRSKSGMVLLVLLYAVLFAGLGMVFYFVGDMLCAPLLTEGLGWLYFVMMALIAIFLGVFGSVFTTYASLYLAKDNALLLAMPIPPSRILMVRLFGVWLWGCIYEAIVFIPALLVYWTAVGIHGVFGVLMVLAGILLFFALSVFVLTLACILGWVVAKISAKLQRKSFVTVLASLAFFALYYYGYSRAYAALQAIVSNAQSVSQRVKGFAYPAYLMGRAGEGDYLSLLLFTLLVAALFALICFILCRSFLPMATANKGAAKKAYKETPAKKKSVAAALLAKERRRFFTSATYMLNCGLGTIAPVVVAILALIKGPWLKQMLMDLGMSNALMAMLACAIICMLSTMNDITAPSVSLEGKNLWLLQSLPVSAWQALQAKLKLHLLLTVGPVLLCGLCVALVLRPGLFLGGMIVVLPILFVFFFAALGLVLNLKMPNLQWKDETVAVKQGFGVLLNILGGWLLVIVLGVGYFLVRSFVREELYLVFAALVLALFAGILLAWLKKKGTAIWEAL